MEKRRENDDSTRARGVRAWLLGLADELGTKGALVTRRDRDIEVDCRLTSLEGELDVLRANVLNLCRLMIERGRDVQ